MPIRSTRTRSIFAVPLALALACAPVLAADPDISKVNGAITVEAGERFGSLQTVNGSIKVGDGARIGPAQTVNGSIQIAANVQAGSLSTVNGSIRLADKVEVGGDVGTVNGSVFVDRGGKVRGDVGTVNGAIGLVATEVGGGIQTVSSDLTVGVGSHVRGGIVYRKPARMLISLNQRRPRVIIGPNARVDGPLVFEREVTLHVHNSATIGSVTGATAVRYAGDRAPPR